MGEKSKDRTTAKIAYIASRGHSGSTLLTMAIGRHRMAAAMGEIANLSLQCYREEPKTKWTGRCDCGQRPFDCEQWGQVIDAIRQEYGADMERRPFSFRISDVGLEEEHRELALRRVPVHWFKHKLARLARYSFYHSNPIAQAAGAFYTPQKRWARNRAFVARQFRQVNNVPLAVDSSKDVLGAVDMHRYSGEDVRILFLTRDPRGSTWSKIKYTKDHPERAQHIDDAARLWSRMNLRYIRLLKNIPPEDLLHVPYESLCHDPETTVRRVEAFLGLPHDEDILKPDPQQTHMVAGNKIRFSLQRFVIREDTAWRKNLTDAEAQRIMAITEPVASQLGYFPDSAEMTDFGSDTASARQDNNRRASG